MSSALDFATPRDAMREMQAAGAVFSVRCRGDALALSFTYSVSTGGHANLCRAILAAVKSRPPLFFQAFRAEAHCDAVGDVETSPTCSISEEGVSTPSTHPGKEGELSSSHSPLACATRGAA